MSTFMRSPLRNGLVTCLVVCMMLLGFLPRDVMAMPIPSNSSTVPEQPIGQRDRDLREIQTRLESKLVAQALSSLGLTAEEIQAKISQLTDDQIHQVAQDLNGVQAGGFHGLLIAMAVVGGIILLFLLLVGHV